MTFVEYCEYVERRKLLFPELSDGYLYRYALKDYKPGLAVQLSGCVCWRDNNDNMDILLNHVAFLWNLDIEAIHNMA